MISDEKRREVSRLLREEFGQGQWQWPDLFRDMLAEILECNETLDGAPLYDQMAEKLADLIDPTCEVASIEPIEYGEFNETIGYVFNLTCGHQVICPYAEMPPSYCSECGKRVVKTDD